jgi:enoyl-CoA hydratase/carnithine racemase
MSEELVIAQERGSAGLITLNRAKALNALNLPMIRSLTTALLKWRDMPQIKRVAIRGMGKLTDPTQAPAAVPIFAPFGAFCAGGDIRFFHQAALAGDPALEDFFTEEYALNHLIYSYPKPYISFLDGIVMGGGMGIAGHGGANSIRLVTERTKMAMPETNIGLFPDVGGGFFLSRCANARPGVGEYLALTGQLLNAPQACSVGLADHQIEARQLPALWEAIATDSFDTTKSIANYVINTPASSQFDLKISSCFAASSVLEILSNLQQEGSEAALQCIATLRHRSPLMLAVTLELVRRARGMSLADDLRLERSLVRHCFHTQHLQRSGVASETVEGIRALAVDKDHAPKWNPVHIEDVTPEMVLPFFQSAWPAHAHPLRDLSFSPKQL